MASLLDRLSTGTGPVRSSKSASTSRSTTPYNRPNRTPKGDINSSWSHDLYDQHNSLSARLNLKPAAPKASFNVIAQKALRDATSPSSSSELSIKGAGTPSGNVVEVTGLVKGTTPEDVSAIFKRCGQITSSQALPGPQLRIRVTFKQSSSAQEAVKSFNNVPADGNVLSVKIIGSTTAGTSLMTRFGSDGLALVRQEGSVDALMNSDDSNSKMRSDALTSDPRAQVLVAPPGANPKDYTQAPARRGGGRGRGNRRGRGRGREAGRMDVD